MMDPLPDGLFTPSYARRDECRVCDRSDYDLVDSCDVCDRWWCARCDDVRVALRMTCAYDECAANDDAEDDA